jgi:hypothetical protein
MLVDPKYLLKHYPGDQSIIKEFIEKYRSTTFENYPHMIKEYEYFIQSLNLIYIEDEI